MQAWLCLYTVCPYHMTERLSHHITWLYCHMYVIIILTISSCDIIASLFVPIYSVPILHDWRFVTSYHMIVMSHVCHYHFNNFIMWYNCKPAYAYIQCAHTSWLNIFCIISHLCHYHTSLILKKLLCDIIISLLVPVYSKHIPYDFNVIYFDNTASRISK